MRQKLFAFLVVACFATVTCAGDCYTLLSANTCESLFGELLPGGGCISCDEDESCQPWEGGYARFNAAMWTHAGGYIEKVPPGDSGFTESTKRYTVCGVYGHCDYWCVFNQNRNEFVCILRPETIMYVPNDLLSGVPCTGQ